MVPLIVLLAQDRRAGLLDPALRANDANQVGATELESVFFADLVQTFEVFASHGTFRA